MIELCSLPGKTLSFLRGRLYVYFLKEVPGFFCSSIANDSFMRDENFEDVSNYVVKNWNLHIYIKIRDVFFLIIILCSARIHFCCKDQHRASISIKDVIKSQRNDNRAGRYQKGKHKKKLIHWIAKYWLRNTTMNNNEIVSMETVNVKTSKSVNDYNWIKRRVLFDRSWKLFHITLSSPKVSDPSI